MEVAGSDEKALAVGDVVAGKYRLVQELGRGAMGVVYRAMQESMSREVALKTLLPHAIIHPSLVARFKREVKVISQLKHPNTITIFDYGSLESGLLYFAMELLDGVALSDVVQAEGTLAPERVRQIAIQILKSLSEAHAKGIIHRDLKPQNIFICNVYGERDYVKVLDFGIAKALGTSDGPGAAPDVTDAGVTLGTPVYMAPEQIDHKAVSPSTDLYALGALLYEMLGGRQLFHGSGWLKIAMKKLGKAPVELRNDILFGPMGGIILKAVQREPEDRYRDAGEMLLDLERLGDLSAARPLPRINAAATTLDDLSGLLLPGSPPRVLGASEHGLALADGATRTATTMMGDLQDPLVSMATTLTPRLERPAAQVPTLELPSPPGSRDDEVTRLVTPAFHDPLDVQATGEFDKDRTKLIPQVEPDAGATQLLLGRSPVDRGALRVAAIAPPEPEADRRSAAVMLALAGLVLLTVSVVVIVALLYINLS
jgi:serine/threonine protein kinase